MEAYTRSLQVGRTASLHMAKYRCAGLNAGCGLDSGSHADRMPDAFRIDNDVMFLALAALLNNPGRSKPVRHDRTSPEEAYLPRHWQLRTT